MMMAMDFNNLDWIKCNGLLPVIIQDYATQQVLMLGYMNNEALQTTCETGKVTFFSRTKNRLWTKGETSGNYLSLISIQPDCDNDSLLIMVKPTGSTCHLNNRSCFKDDNSHGLGMLTTLDNMIKQRYQERPDNSYVAQLFNEGVKRIAQKVGEEGLEVALAAVSGIKEEIKNESADLVFHLLVLLKECGVDLMDVMFELNKRNCRLG